MLERELSDDEQMCYAAFDKECGCIAAAAVDRPEYAKSHAKEVAHWIRDGLEVRRISVTEVRTAMTGRPIGKCIHKRSAQPELALDSNQH